MGGGSCGPACSGANPPAPAAGPAAWGATEPVAAACCAAVSDGGRAGWRILSSPASVGIPAPVRSAPNGYLTLIERIMLNRPATRAWFRVNDLSSAFTDGGDSTIGRMDEWLQSAFNK
jgi:hypothetical protein